MTENGTIKDHGHLKPADICWDAYFMDICRVVGEKGTCDRGRCGCVIVRDNVILATGFVDAPLGSKKCDEVGHLMWNVEHEDGEITHHCMRNNCAEQNAIAHAAKNGISLEGATMYVKMTPCTVRHCAHMVVACGIKRVVCEKRYQNSLPSEELFRNAGVMFEYLEEGEVTYGCGDQK